MTFKDFENMFKAMEKEALHKGLTVDVEINDEGFGFYMAEDNDIVKVFHTELDGDVWSIIVYTERYLTDLEETIMDPESADWEYREAAGFMECAMHWGYEPSAKLREYMHC